MATIDLSEPTVLIVGAGMTGLMAAAALPEYGHLVSLVEKSRSAGGRLATRRLAGGRADHGAQFFTARSPEFAAWVERWQGEGLVVPWSFGWSDGSLDAPAEAAHGGHPRFMAKEGMNALARRLAAEASAAGATVHKSVTVQAISRAGDGWWVCSDDGRVYQSSVLVLTCPVPQALALLEEGGVALAPDDQSALAALRYAPCLCLLVAVEGEFALPEPGAVQRPSAEVPWMADNRRKGISPERTIVTLHASPELSRRLYDADDSTVIEAILPALAPWMDHARAEEVQVKRWRYALPEVVMPQRLLRAQGLPPLFFGGDAFGGPRVEGAALSGLALAAELRTLLVDSGAQPRPASSPAPSRSSG